MKIESIYFDGHLSTSHFIVELKVWDTDEVDDLFYYEHILLYELEVKHGVK